MSKFPSLSLVALYGDGTPPQFIESQCLDLQWEYRHGHVFVVWRTAVSSFSIKKKGRVKENPKWKKSNAVKIQERKIVETNRWDGSDEKDNILNLNIKLYYKYYTNIILNSIPIVVNGNGCQNLKAWSATLVSLTN